MLGNQKTQEHGCGQLLQLVALEIQIAVAKQKAEKINLDLNLICSSPSMHTFHFIQLHK